MIWSIVGGCACAAVGFCLARLFPRDAQRVIDGITVPRLAERIQTLEQAVAKLCKDAQVRK